MAGAIVAYAPTPCSSSPSSEGPLVFLTREESKNDKLRARLEGRGIKTFELPLVEHTRNAQGIDQLVDKLRSCEGQVAWFVTTSPESASVFTECWRQAGSPGWPRVASIGMGTSKTLEEGGAGHLIRFTPSKATGKVMASELPLSAPGLGDQRGGDRQPPVVVYPSSELASNDIEGGLASRGFKVTRINTYSTRPVGRLTEQQEIAAREAVVVTFGSPSAIKAWKHLTGRTDVYSCCIGGTSHDACIRSGFEEEKVYAPDKPGLAGWTDVVVEVVDLLERESA
ncbi:uroporphyrinogen-III synthase [Chloropicon primus]|nr:uroporphyrinogen-III synthase [Chloropicon primus]